MGLGVDEKSDWGGYGENTPRITRLRALALGFPFSCNYGPRSAASAAPANMLQMPNYQAPP